MGGGGSAASTGRDWDTPRPTYLPPHAFFLLHHLHINYLLVIIYMVIVTVYLILILHLALAGSVAPSSLSFLLLSGECAGAPPIGGDRAGTGASRTPLSRRLPYPHSKQE